MRLTVIVLLAVALLAPCALGQAPQPRPAEILARLGPDPFWGLPDTLGSLVKGASAAAVVRFVGFGELQARELPNPWSGKSLLVVHAVYKVRVEEVLFTRNPAGPVPLESGAELVVFQRVGRESAQRFLARRVPVAVGDQCLVILDALDDIWELPMWHLLFRRSPERPAAAESLASPVMAKGLTPQWFGANVPVASSHDRPEADWSALVKEVRRLGSLESGR